jgi:formylglycine-generating enzyme required for sulfatase activity
MDPDVVKEMNKQVALAQNNRFLKKITPEEAEVIIKANTIDRQRTVYPLEMSRTEIPYRLWKQVKGWAEDNGYSFNYSGDMGSMRHASVNNYSYEQDEPVTQICWYDAVVWCNAASEILGRTPVYYADSGRTQPYTNALWFRLDMFADQGSPNMPWATVMEKGSRPHTGSGDRLYMKVSADGIRLPLDVEFAKANKQPSGTEVNEEWTAANAKDKTHSVGSKAAYANGLCDMNGHVFEWGWDSEKVNFEFQNASYNINGGGYFYETQDKTKPRPANPASYSEYTSVARSFVGFRVSAVPAR